MFDSASAVLATRMISPIARRENRSAFRECLLFIFFSSHPFSFSVAVVQRRPRQFLPDRDFSLACGVGLITPLDGTVDAMRCIEAPKAVPVADLRRLSHFDSVLQLVASAGVPVP